MIASQTPNRELTFPNSFGGTSLDISDLKAINDVPLSISTKAPATKKDLYNGSKVLCLYPNNFYVDIYVYFVLYTFCCFVVLGSITR